MSAWAYDTGVPYEIAGHIAIDGGTYPTPDNQGYLYDPATNTWGVFPNFVHATRNYGAAQLNGILYAFGGYNFTNNLPDGANFNQSYDASTPFGSPTPTVTGTPPTATNTRTPTSTTAPTNTNTPTLTPSPTPTICGQPLVEGFETGSLNSFSSTGTPGWTVVTTAAHSGGHSAFAPDPATITDQRLTLNNAIPIGATAISATLSFWQHYDFETSGGNFYDGGVLETSTNGGANWADAGANILINGYTGTLSSCCGNPLSGRQAWTGPSGVAFTHVVVNLLPYAGQSLLFRFRLGTDSIAAATGWWMDDVAVVITDICPSPTPTRTATPTFTRTATPTQTPTLTRTATPTLTQTPTITPTPTNTLTPTITPTPTNTLSPTITPTPSDTPTPSNTPTPSDTPTITLTPTVTVTATNTPSHSPTVTPTDTPLISATVTATATVPPSGTPTATVTVVCPPAWAAVSSPNVGTARSVLRAVAVAGPNDVWAVGSAYDTPLNADRTLIEHWNGSAWTVVPSPNASVRLNVLSGLAVVNPYDIWAVGTTLDDAIIYQTLIMHWNGVQWSLVPSPNATGFNFLNSVVALSATDIWAVGNYSPVGVGGPTLILHWNGTAWSIVTSPSVGASNYLYGITALSPSDIWAVGAEDSGGELQTLTLHWNGTTWSVVASPNVGPSNNILQAVAALAANDIWAIGTSTLANQTTQTLTMHWDGTTWNVVASPNFGAADNRLNGLVALAPNDVWAVGMASLQSLALHWDGLSWSRVTTPNSGPSTNYFYGMAAAGPSDLWAVGYYSTGGVDLTMTAHYAGSCPSPTPTPCPVQFNDVPVGSTFYDYIRCLACRGIVSGYPCGGPGEPCPGAYFRPGNNVTRGQVSKIVSEVGRLRGAGAEQPPDL